MGSSTRERDEERRRWLWWAVPASLVVHGLAMLSAPTSRGAQLHATSPWLETSLVETSLVETSLVEALVGSAGATGTEPLETTAAGAPGQVASETRSGSNDARSNDARSNGASRSAVTSTEPPELGAATSGATSASSGEAAPEDALGAEGAGGLSNDAFLDGLLARGAGVGGANGDGCGDPIRGTWRARRYDEEGVGTDALGHHAVFTLRVTGHEGDRLAGTIELRAWSGDASETSPPRCRLGHYDHTVRMRARGTLRGAAFALEALDHERTEHCMDLGRWAYNLDHFRGRLDGEVLSVVNNDGGREVNAPYRFRRVACE